MYLKCCLPTNEGVLIKPSVHKLVDITVFILQNILIAQFAIFALNLVVVIEILQLFSFDRIA